MFGLSIRWSLAEAPAEVAQQLSDYVTGTSLARFTGLAGLQVKLWRMVPGEWFEGTYVFDTAAERDGFAESFAAQAATAPGSVIIGSPPIMIEPCEIVAIAEGAAGFRAGQRSA